MARYHFTGRAVDTYGNAQAGVGVEIYLFDTLTPATIYQYRTGGTPISTVPQVTTDALGRFSLYVDSADYATSQSFDILAAGQQYSDIEIMRGINVHSELTGLPSDDHPQYGALAQNETVTGKWTFTQPISGVVVIGGYPITSISNDPTLSDADPNAVTTEYAVKTHIDMRDRENDLNTAYVSAAHVDLTVLHRTDSKFLSGAIDDEVKLHRLDSQFISAAHVDLTVLHRTDSKFLSGAIDDEVKLHRLDSQFISAAHVDLTVLHRTDSKFLSGAIDDLTLNSNLDIAFLSAAHVDLTVLHRTDSKFLSGAIDDEVKLHRLDSAFLSGAHVDLTVLHRTDSKFLSGAIDDEVKLHRLDSQFISAAHVDLTVLHRTDSKFLSGAIDDEVKLHRLDSQFISAAHVDLRTDFDNVHNDTSEPTGFVNRTDSTITFSDATSAMTITPVGSYSYYIKGVKYTISSPKTLAVLGQGLNFFYLDNTETLNVINTFDVDVLLKDNAYITVVYWDNVDKKLIYFGDERHGITWDWNIHAYHHLTEGTRYESGLSLTDITADGNGSQNRDAVFGVTSGYIRDEDLRHTISELPSGSPFYVFYREGVSGDWTWDTPNQFPVKTTGSGRLAYNSPSGGTWMQTEAASGAYVLAHIFATNDVNNGIIAIQGQNEYLTVASARTAATTEILSLSTGVMPFAEFTPIGTVIYQTSLSYTNSINARIITTDEGDLYVDFRNLKGSSTGGTNVDKHSNLSGLLDDDHTQYALITGTRDFTGTIGGVNPVTSTDFTTRGWVENLVTTTSNSLSAATDEADNRIYETFNVLTASISAASVEADNRIYDTFNVLNASLSAASVEADNRVLDYVNSLSTSVSAATVAYVDAADASLSAASVEADNRIYDTFNVLTSSLSAASKEQDNRVYDTFNVLTGSLSAASVEADNRVKDYVNSSISLSINSLSAASDEADNRIYDTFNVLTASISAASKEQDNRIYSTFNTLTTSISAASIEGDNRVYDTFNVLTTSLSAASREQDNRLYEYVDLIGGGGGAKPNFVGSYTTGIKTDQTTNVIGVSANGSEEMYINDTGTYIDDLHVSNECFLNRTYMGSLTPTGGGGWFEPTSEGFGEPSGSAPLKWNGYFYATRVYNAWYNDIADFARLHVESETKYGKTYFETGNGIKMCDKRCQKGTLGIASDTYGFGIGTRDKYHTPIAIGGWVLAYVDKEYEPGTALTNDKFGNLTKMRLYEKILYPERIVAIYKNKENCENLKLNNNVINVNNRHWVKVK